ncbi:hypothetical protein [Noviherbaspirillum aerium]|uniref:hypothetical protein n=1 Tax=Noviherbaspirillum aerium TaxID=2588497 RepID=UPI00178C2F53|nr:hypothetical protein [Noviherbaspirillum aerium]
MTTSKTLFTALAVHDGSTPQAEGALAEYIGAGAHRPGRAVTIDPREAFQS